MKKVFLLLLSVMLVAFDFSVAQVAKQQITLDDLFKKGTFRSKSIWGLTPMNDDEYYSALDDKGRVVKYKFTTGEQVEVLFDPSAFQVAELKGMSSYRFSDDENLMLIET
ncbi:MAG TPA: S9 family peptidase, partial [Bacteroidales bacterium]|nr:S9 family peptidase [Bacteroidales bacterium]